MYGNEELVLAEQRALRKHLFEGSSAIRWHPGRELAAQILLYLDDPQACLRITVEWIRDILDADRVDGGYGGYVLSNGLALDYVAEAESKRLDIEIPAVLGKRFDAFEAGLRNAWATNKLFPVESVSQNKQLSNDLRNKLAKAGTMSKIAMPLRNGNSPVGMICADWHVDYPTWNNGTCNEMEIFVKSAIGPLLATSQRLAKNSVSNQVSTPLLEPSSLGIYTVSSKFSKFGFTASEEKVATLVAGGLSYKEVARQLGKSLSTIDHQLRSIREKTGAKSTSRLVSLLGEIDEKKYK